MSAAPERFELALRADLSPALTGRSIVTVSVGPRDDAVLLATSGRGLRRPLTYLRHEGSSVVQTTELGAIDVAPHFVQPLPNGEILVVAARHGLGEDATNAIVLDASGTERRRFSLGDGIEDVQTSERGAIWVSYFDEGVYGGTQPADSGLACFDADGRVTWTFTPPPGVGPIDDCYALNVAGDDAWACYYTDFPLVRVEGERNVRAWTNGVGGARGFAVDEERVLFWGGYRDDATRCVVQELGATELERSRRIELALPLRDRTEVVVRARGSMLHAFTKDAWYAFDLRSVP